MLPPGPNGRCYAKSVPTHIYDPVGEPRQQGRTTIFRVMGGAKDIPVHRFDWFSQRIFLLCGLGDDTVVVRVGPSHRGRSPRADHLAIAFYKGGKLLKRYSTSDIAAGGNVSASVSHYAVFASGPEMATVAHKAGGVYRESWVIKAKTVDGRVLVFDLTTGEVR